MAALDAFRAFDQGRTGELTCSELYAGLEWLGLSMTPAQIYELVRAIDSDGDGLISLADFRSAFQLEGDDADGGGGDAGGGDAVGDAPRDSQPGDDGGGEIQIAAKTIRELHDARAPGGAGGGGGARVTPVPLAALKRFKVKVQKVEAWPPGAVWTSRGMGARSEVAVWGPKQEKLGLRGRNREKLVIGHYGVAGLGDIASASRAAAKAGKRGSSAKGAKGGDETFSRFDALTLELTDQGVMRLSASEHLDHVRARDARAAPRAAVGRSAARRGSS